MAGKTPTICIVCKVRPVAGRFAILCPPCIKDKAHDRMRWNGKPFTPIPKLEK